MKNVTIIESATLLVLFSYSTPVAYFDKTEGKVYQTNMKHSRTTTKHIKTFFNEYLIPKHFRALNTVYVEQDDLNKRFPLSVGGL